jgi:hypothetical protein
MPKNKGKLYTGIALDRDVAEYLDLLRTQTHLSRSRLLNALVREHLRLVQQKRGGEDALRPLLNPVESVIR